MSSRFNDLMQDWEYKPLSEILAFIVDNRGKSVPTEQWGIPLIATNCIKNSELFPTYDKVRYVSKETYDSWFRSHPIPGDIIFVNKGKPGSVAMVPEPVDFCMAQDMMAFRVKKDIIYNKFLFAVLRSQLFQTQIMNYHVGTMIPHFKKSDLDKLLIPVPDMKIQEYIGNLYYNFSYKIEVNNQINKTLENIAQTIFKQWFVDFEFPNGAGEPYKSSGGEMVESELGMIPKGWEVKSLDDVADFLNGLAMQKYPPINDKDSFPVLKIKELRQGFTDDNSDICSNMIDEKYVINDGDLIFSWSGSLMVDFWCGGQCGLNQHLFKVTSQNYNKWFYYLWTKHHLNKFIEIAKSKATTMGHIKRKDLTDSKVIVPANKEFYKIENIVQPIIENMIYKNIENKKLIKLRDSLLPKLMSGEIRVPIEEN